MSFDRVRKLEKTKLQNTINISRKKKGRYEWENIA